MMARRGKRWEAGRSMTPASENIYSKESLRVVLGYVSFTSAIPCNCKCDVVSMCAWLCFYGRCKLRAISIAILYNALRHFILLLSIYWFILCVSFNLLLRPSTHNSFILNSDFSCVPTRVSCKLSCVADLLCILSLILNTIVCNIDWTFLRS